MKFINTLKEGYANILTNIGAVLVFAQAMYPGLNYEMIMISISNGTFIQGVVNMVLAYMLIMAGKVKTIIAPQTTTIDATKLPDMPNVRDPRI